jgi:hypothetical protein
MHTEQACLERAAMTPAPPTPVSGGARAKTTAGPARVVPHFAEHRGFAPGHELDDWLTAESDVDARLIGEICPY